MVVKIELYDDDDEPRQKDVKKKQARVKAAREGKPVRSSNYPAFQRAAAEGLSDEDIMTLLGIGPLQVAAFRGRSSV